MAEAEIIHFGSRDQAIARDAAPGAPVLRRSPEDDTHCSVTRIPGSSPRTFPRPQRLALCSASWADWPRGRSGA